MRLLLMLNVIQQSRSRTICMTSETEWRWRCRAENLQRLRADREFHLMCTIGHAVNAFRFAMGAVNGTPKEPTPLNDRQRTGGVLYAAGWLHEMLNFRETHAKKWGDLPLFHAVFGILDDATTDADTAELLESLRNRAVFHLDPSIPGGVLPRLSSESLTFAWGIGPRPMDANFDLPDFLLFAHLFMQDNDLKATHGRFRDFHARIRRLAVRFVETAEREIFSRLHAHGFELDRLPSGTYRNELLVAQGDDDAAFGEPAG